MSTIIFLSIVIVLLFVYILFQRKALMDWEVLGILEARRQIMNNWELLASGEYESDALFAYLNAAQDLYTLFAAKNKDYGLDNITVGGLEGIVLRSGDKISRLWNLLGIGAASTEDARVMDESIADSFADLSNYVIIGYCLSKGYLNKDLLPEDHFGPVAVSKVFAGVLHDNEDNPEVREKMAAAFVTERLRKSFGGRIIND